MREDINAASRNLQDIPIDRLVRRYPSHSFIVEREETGTLFERVLEPDNQLKGLSEQLRELYPYATATMLIYSLD